MMIHIEALSFEVIIGLLDFERITPQPVRIDMDIGYAYQENDFINYADIVTLVEVQMHQKRYKLLEEALLGLKASLVTTYPQIQTLKLKISKPTILPNCNVALSNHWNF